MGRAAIPEALRSMTAEELFDLPDDGVRHELVNGELRSRTPAGYEHGDIAGEVNAKVVQWLDAGVRLVWVVDPETRSVVVHDSGGLAHPLRGDDVLGGGDVLPGFTLPLRDLFPDD